MKFPTLTTIGIAAAVAAFSLGVLEGQSRLEKRLSAERLKLSQIEHLRLSHKYSLLYKFFKEVGANHPAEFASVCANSEIPYLLACVAIVESNGEPTMRGSKGEIGAWQVIPKYHGTVPNDIPGQAAQAERILLSLLNDSDMYTALRKYNAGSNYNGRQAREYGGKVLTLYAKLVVQDVDN